jgi:uncharacterized protein
MEGQDMIQSETRPTPIRTAGTSIFFDGAKSGKLMLQRCLECHQFNLTGYQFCSYCLNSTEWIASEGLGRINSFSIVTETSHPGFKELLPYVVAEVTLHEGPNLGLRLVVSNPESISIGQQVQMSFLNEGASEATPIWNVI